MAVGGGGVARTSWLARVVAHARIGSRRRHRPKAAQGNPLPPQPDLPQKFGNAVLARHPHRVAGGATRLQETPNRPRIVCTMATGSGRLDYFGIDELLGEEERLTRETVARLVDREIIPS